LPDGCKVQAETPKEDVLIDADAEQGDLVDGHSAPAVGRVIQRTGRRPRTVTADRGYGEAAVENDLQQLVGFHNSAMGADLRR
jgi:transposase, IS5 family